MADPEDPISRHTQSISMRSDCPQNVDDNERLLRMILRAIAYNPNSKTDPTKFSADVVMCEPAADEVDPVIALHD